MDILNRLTEDWNNIKDINVYGFGRVGKRNIGKLNQDFNIIQVIDNSPELIGKYYNDSEIKSFDCCKEQFFKRKTIVTTSSVAYASIKEQLKSIGLVEFKDFCRLEHFMPEWYWKNKRQVCISQIFSSVTSKCTLKCKHCNMLMPYFKEHYNCSAQEIIEDFEMLFKRVDYITSYFILGGEPLLNNELPQIIDKVNEKFGDKIGYIQVITNGTLVPNDELLASAKKNNVDIRLSDYTNVVPYEKKLQEVKEVFKNHEMEYSTSTYDTWLDIGLPNPIKPIGTTFDELRNHMRTCSFGCHGLSNKKIYYCSVMMAADKCGLHKVREGDYIDLTKTSGDIKLDKKKLLEYFLGEVPNGYISTCRVCRGMGPDNKYIIPVAEQM